MARKFKVGDLVRVDSPREYSGVALGTVAKVEFVEPEDYPGTLFYQLSVYGLDYDVWAGDEELQLVESAAPEVSSASQLTEDERFFAYSLIQNGREVERVLDIIRTLRKGV